MIKMRVYAITLLTLFVFGCTTIEISRPTPEELATEQGYRLGPEVKDIRNYELDGWNYVSSRALIIPARPSKHYLVTFRTDCSELSLTEVIGFTSTNSFVLSNFDAVIVRDRRRGIDNRCYIDKIYEITRLKDQDTE